METQDHPAVFRHVLGDCRWDGVACQAYKEEGAAPFKAVSRQVLFSQPELAAELRYFEVAAGGWSTLERHAHVHAVMVLRGHGSCLVGCVVRDIRRHDLISVPPMTWHQFRAAADQPLGFLCLVNADRDRPQLPDADDLADLCTDPGIAAFLAQN
ncbi:MAG: cupin domain-containing protein [Azospirillum sp.]|nr:cupin domain-containing protein [Azospirillum sp.]